MNTKTISFRGVDYRVAFLDIPGHASHWTFEDEKGVRDETWNILPGDVILDVGAAYGSYTMAALSAGAAFVYAWVPQISQEVELFKASLALNGWTNRVRIICDTGIFDRTGFLDVDSQQFTNQSTGTPSCIAVESLDNWIDRNPPLKSGRKWLKVDVEGAEVAVIVGGTRFIKQQQPIIQIENHLFKRSTIDQEVKAAVESLGYRQTYNRPYHSVSHSVFMPL